MLKTSAGQPFSYCWVTYGKILVVFTPVWQHLKIAASEGAPTPSFSGSMVPFGPACATQVIFRLTVSEM